MTNTHTERRLLSVASILLAAAVTTTAAPAPARAQVVVFGGGDTGASLALRAIFNCYGRILSATGLQHPWCTAPNTTRRRLFMYAPRGSSAGINTFLRDDPTRMGIPSAAVAIPLETSNPADTGVTAFEQTLTPPTYPLGRAVFSVAPPFGYPNHHFSVSSAILPQTDIVGINDRSFDCYSGIGTADPSCRYGDFDGGVGGLDATQTKAGPAFQVPMAVTTVNMPFRLVGAGSASLSLSRVAYCGIWQGTINNWNHPAILATNPGLATNPLVTQPGGQPIIRFVRQDGSGTTFLFVNALEASCDGAGGRANWTGGTGELATWGPTRFYLAPGNESVAAAVASTNWSIGYTTNESTIPAVTTLNVPEAFTVNDFDPATPAITIPANPSLPARQRAALQNNATPPAFVFPSPISGGTAMSGIIPPTGAARLSPAAWGYAGYNPFPTTAGSYPIAGFTWFLGYTCYADTAVAQAVRGFWGEFTGRGGEQLRNVLSAFQYGNLPLAWRFAVRDLVTIDPATRIGGVLEPPTTGNVTCSNPIGNLPHRIGG